MKKKILITGTRKGIGKALSEYYLKAGHTVIGCSRKKQTITHERYAHYELDIADEKSVMGMVRDIRNRHDGLEVLLNNAGVASMNHLMITPLDSARRIMDTNFLGTFLLMREVAKLMKKKRRGTIVNFSTVAVPLRLEGEAIYAASKAAVVSLTETAAREFSDFGIRINAIGPTPINTDLIKHVPREKIDDLVRRQAIKRLGRFKDIANVIDFFIDERSDFITGQVIYLGGIHN